ncbi:MAG: aminotransferase class V-fold PLP-dependent enzyme [Pirellulales bacterium]
MKPDRIYLDNAATSWPKPPSVLEAVLTTMRDNGASAGRGSYDSSLAAAQIVEDARRRMAKLIGAEQPARIAFGFNGTDVLNLAISGMIPHAEYVATTAADHNSVHRPLQWWYETHPQAKMLEAVGCDVEGRVKLHKLESAFARGADLLVVTHASNVTGTIQPLEQILEMAQQYDVRTILDAAQTLGHEPLNVQQLPFDVVVGSGHKGLLGPLGTGVLYLRPGLEDHLTPSRFGGTGTESESPRHPQTMPFKFEAGNHNVPGLAGLAAGIAWLESQGVEALRDRQRSLLGELIERLRSIDAVTLYGTQDPSQSVAVLSFNIAGFDPQEVAALLDSQYGIEVRSGLHCAPLIHQSICSLPLGGTVRVSLGPFNTREHLEQLAAAVEEIAAASG